MKYRLVYDYERQQKEFDDIIEMLRFLNDFYDWDKDEIFEDEDFSPAKVIKGLRKDEYFEFCDCDYVEYANKPFEQKCEHDLTFE